MSTKLTIRPTWVFEIEVLPTLEIGGAIATLDNTPDDSSLDVSQVIGMTLLVGSFQNNLTALGDDLADLEPRIADLEAH
ncbi:hypothetical protein GGQ80_002102 [Sphingomonas jinjuensis]|uniref:Uncharacterized protein n=1 Tax=Sphingomonas jinjuensis TaxID=535907 RepID=A0A840FC20_9SPHN|nr:hypothetical protein [Sphingomonas jinjuensis]MBB4154192.1 hypothetical protein [Sphingomonas jinjuensis]